MTDDDLMTAVRHSFSGVGLAVPVETTVRRGNALRARHRLMALGTGGAVTAIACTGILALAGALPTGSSQARPTAGAANSATGAWTVSAGAGHSLHITFNRWPQQRADANGLQAALRADGVRIRVFVPPNSMSMIPAACAPVPYDRAASEYAGLSFTGKKTASSPVPGTNRDHLTIFVRPAPPGIGLYLELTPTNWQAGILRATPSCM